MQQPLTCVEICAGAGGQALGLAMAGFVHVALVEYEEEYCKVLKQNRPEWNVICADVHDFDGRPYKGVDLLAGGVPCPPFSVAAVSYTHLVQYHCPADHHMAERASEL